MLVEINITHLMNPESFPAHYYSGSVAELGDEAGRITWNNSLERVRDEPIIPKEALPEVRNYFSTFGAWSKDEIDSWDESEVQALALQFIAGSIRELEAYPTYEEYQEANGQIFKDEDGQFYICLSE